jgi:hypothetical protein
MEGEGEKKRTSSARSGEQKQIRAKAKRRLVLGAKKREKERDHGGIKRNDQSIIINQTNNLLYRSDESILQGWARRGQLLTMSNRAGADHPNPGLARSVALTLCEFIGADGAQESHDRLRLRPASAVLQQVAMDGLYWLVLVGC